MRRNQFSRFEVEDPIHRPVQRQMPPPQQSISAMATLGIMFALAAAALGLSSLILSTSSKETLEDMTHNGLLHIGFNGSCLLADKKSVIACNTSTVGSNVLLVMCWDRNGNGKCDLTTEDANNDGNCTIDDCIGKNGTDCWDTNGDRLCSPGEDVNNDGKCDTKDCRGTKGEKGDPIKIDLIHNLNETVITTLEQSYPSLNITGAAFYYIALDSRANKSIPIGLENNQTGNLVSFDGLDWTNFGPFTGVGVDGYNCWDKNQNHACDVSTEDINSDGACNVTDCIGPQGIQGLYGQNGTNGFHCWDLNQNYLCDVLTEDLNNDTVCNVSDCTGAKGAQGLTGPKGTACWDLNGDGICNVTTEDINLDGNCTVADCTPSLNGATINNAILNNPTITNPTVTNGNFTTPNIINGTLSNPTVTTGSFSNPTVTSGTFSNPTVTSGSFTSSTITNPTVTNGNFTTPNIINGTFSNPTVTTGTFSSPTISSPTVTGGTFTSSSLVSPTITGANITFAIDGSSHLDDYEVTEFTMILNEQALANSLDPGDGVSPINQTVTFTGIRIGKTAMLHVKSFYINYVIIPGGFNYWQSSTVLPTRFQVRAPVFVTVGNAFSYYLVGTCLQEQFSGTYTTGEIYISPITQKLIGFRTTLGGANWPNVQFGFPSGFSLGPYPVN